MIQINLLPRRVKKRKVSHRQVYYGYLLGIALTLIVIASVWVIQRMEISDLQERLARLENEVRQYAKYEALLKEVTQKKLVVDKKRDIIKNLQQDRDTVVRLMAVISAEIPADKIWLERLVQSSNTMTLSGVAMNNEAIAEFMRNLESSPFVTKGSVNLAHSRQTVISSMKLREFQITYQFMPFSQVPKPAGQQGS